MPEKLIIHKLNDVYLRINCSESVAQELNEYFSFKSPGYYFMPAYKNGWWDGFIRLFSLKNRTLYVGLLSKLDKFCEEHNYEGEITFKVYNNDYSREEAIDFIKSLKIPEKFALRDYQIDSFVLCIKNQRMVLLSSTASGKSYLIYLLLRYFKTRTLIIVPTTNLVNQMFGDFKDYGFDSDRFCHMIFSGQEKITTKPIVISTWQSIWKFPKEWFSKFELVIGDECHQFKAKCLTEIMKKLENCSNRFGMTGTLDGKEVHQLVLEGLFGPIEKLITTKELIEKKFLSELVIKNLILSYTSDERNLVKKLAYQDEINFLINHELRNKFLSKLALSLKGNTLLLFNYVEKHGKLLYNIVKDKNVDDRKVFFIHGLIDGETRNQIRAIVEKEKDAIIVASLGTFSKGVNIINLNNIIFGSPFKSQITLLQSVGRGLRRSVYKQHATIYDLADDLSYKYKSGKVRKNYTLNHFLERVNIYNQEGFEYRNYTIPLVISNEKE